MNITPVLVKFLAMTALAVSAMTSTPTMEAADIPEEPPLAIPANTPLTSTSLTPAFYSHKSDPESVATPKHLAIGCSHYQALFDKYDWPVATAIEICLAESHGDPLNVGDKNTAYVSCGLMQIRSLPGRPSCTQLKDPETNVAYAYKLWKSGEDVEPGTGFCPWSTYQSPLGYCQH